LEAGSSNIDPELSCICYFFHEWTQDGSTRQPLAIWTSKCLLCTRSRDATVKEVFLFLRIAAPDRLEAIWMLLSTKKARNPYIWTCEEDMQATLFWANALKESCKNSNGHLDAAANEQQPQTHTSGPTLKTCKPGYLDLVPNSVAAEDLQRTHKTERMPIFSSIETTTDLPDQAIRNNRPRHHTCIPEM